MSSIEWKSMKVADTHIAWRLCSVELSKTFFSSFSDMVVVPNIQEASYFNLLACFSKPNPKGVMNNVKKLWKKSPDYCLHGHIAELSRYDKIKALFNAITVKADVASSKSVMWETTSDGISKKIRIELQGLSKENIDWSQLDEGDLVFDREVLDLEGRRTLFIITEVIYAEKVGINVSVSVDKGIKETTLDINKKIPVAFSYMKFPMDKYEILKQARDTDVKI